MILCLSKRFRSGLLEWQPGNSWGEKNTWLISQPHKNSSFWALTASFHSKNILSIHNVNQAITMIQSIGHGMWLAKISNTFKAFKVMPIHPDLVQWLNKFYFTVRLTFGCKAGLKYSTHSPKRAAGSRLINTWSLTSITCLIIFLIILPRDAIPAVPTQTCYQCCPMTLQRCMKTLTKITKIKILHWKHQ